MTAHVVYTGGDIVTIDAGLQPTDLVVLDRNPLTVDPMQIKDISVLETVKEGQTIYSA